MSCQLSLSLQGVYLFSDKTYIIPIKHAFYEWKESSILLNLFPFSEMPKTGLSAKEWKERLVAYAEGQLKEIGGGTNWPRSILVQGILPPIRTFFAEQCFVFVVITRTQY